MNLTLVVVGKDQTSCAAFRVASVTDGATLELVDNRNNLPLSVIGNLYLNKAHGVVGVVHADTIFHDGALESFCADAKSGKVCGIVGRDYGGLYRWCFVEEDGPITGKPGRVCTLDSCSVFLRTDLGLRFDEKTFDSFHCHVEDICMQANERKIPVVVSRANATHASQIPSPAWTAHYQPYRAKLQAKWAGRQLWTT